MFTRGLTFIELRAPISSFNHIRRLEPRHAAGASRGVGWLTVKMKRQVLHGRAHIIVDIVISYNYDNWK